MQLQPLLCRGFTSPSFPFPIFGWKASGFLSRHALMALNRSISLRKLLQQLLQLQLLQKSPLAKQSQYPAKAILGGPGRADPEVKEGPLTMDGKAPLSS